jgi:hypothetical protein
MAEKTRAGLAKLLLVRCCRASGPLKVLTAVNAMLLSHEVKTDRMPDVHPFSGKDR